MVEGLFVSVERNYLERFWRIGGLRSTYFVLNFFIVSFFYYIFLFSSFFLEGKVVRVY